jgi:hypothetical protein
MRGRASALAERIAAEDGLDATCGLIEAAAAGEEK